MDTPHRGALEWTALVQEHERSELSIKEFCRRREISSWTFREWRQRLAEDRPELELVEIGRGARTGATGGSMRALIAPVMIEIGTPVDGRT